MTDNKIRECNELLNSAYNELGKLTAKKDYTMLIIGGLVQLIGFIGFVVNIGDFAFISWVCGIVFFLASVFVGYEGIKLDILNNQICRLIEKIDRLESALEYLPKNNENF